MIRLFPTALLLMPGVAFAQTISPDYLPEPTLAAANNRSQQECVLLSCGPGTTFWWPTGSFFKPDSNGNQAYLVIQQSGDYGPASASNTVSAPLNSTELNSLVTQAQVSPSVLNNIPQQTASVNTPWTFTIPDSTFVDPRQETLTYTITSDLNWLTINNNTISGTPPETGSWTVTITATDQSNFSTDLTFTLVVQ